MSQRLARGFLHLFFSAVAALAQPVVNAIENNYSYVPPGLPNYGIAQGSIFAIFGTNLGADSSGLQSVPLNTNLDGVSVQFTVQGTTTQALIYYVTPNQIGGILPSATPIGSGTVTVITAGQASAPAPVVVVRSAIGFLALDGYGFGPASAFDANWQPLSSTNAANPGDVIVLYGSGAGPVSGDESVQQVQQNLSNVPIEMEIGGIPATVNYHGRSQYPGLDQFNVVIPSGPVGCYVSVVARSGDIVSNIAFVPVAVGSRACSNQVPGVTFTALQLDTGRDNVRLGEINLDQDVTLDPALSGPAADYEDDSVFAVFQQQQITPGDGLESGISSLYPSIGNCIVVAFRSLAATSNAAAQPPIPLPLDAGPALNFIGPSGSESATQQAGTYAGFSGSTGNDAPLFIPSGGENLMIDNGSGGADVGAFATQIDVPPPLVWSNVSGIAAIDRSQGATLTWTGGDPHGYVAIQGMSTVNTATETIGLQLNCTAAVSAHQFTIPASVLLAMPPQSYPSPGQPPRLQIQNATNFLFTAPGIDGGIMSVTSRTSLNVAYR